MSDVKETDQEFLPRDGESSEDTTTGKKVAVGSQGSWSRLVDVMQGTTSGLRKQNQKVNAQSDLIRSYRHVEEELHALMETGKRMKLQESMLEAEYAAKGADYKIRAEQQELELSRLKREALEEKNRADLLTLEHDLKRESLELQLDEIRQRRLALQGQASEPQKEVVDPNVEQARTAIKRYMDRHQHLGRDKKQWFTQIEEDLVSGAISEDLADEMKEDIEQIIRDNVLSP